MAGESWPVVPLADQALYLAHTAAGHEMVIQVLWRYRHPVNPDGLREFHSHLEHGLLARLIRPSTLPFGRHHWVRVPPSASTLSAGQPLPPGDLQVWANQQVQRPLHPADGPGWHLAVQPFTDGSTAVSLVVSHCIADGTAAVMATCEAVRGERRPMENPPHAVRHGRAASIASEGRQLLHDSPAIIRALARLVWSGMGMIRLPRRKSPRVPSSPSEDLSRSQGQIIDLPSVSVAIPSAAWSARATDLGVSDSTLLTAISATLAARIGRDRDGSATVHVPINLRSGSSDSGGNQVALAVVRVNTEMLRGSLKPLQRALVAAIRTARRNHGGLAALLPLIPFVPRWVAAAGARHAFGHATDLPVSCSHMGAFPPDVVRIDGTDAEVFLFRGVDRQLSRRALERRGGVATLLSGVAGDSMLLNFVAYQPGAVTDSAQLQAIVEQILAGQQLRGEVLL